LKDQPELANTLNAGAKVLLCTTTAAPAPQDAQGGKPVQRPPCAETLADVIALVCGSPPSKTTSPACHVVLRTSAADERRFSVAQKIEILPRWLP
jgi:hypothetical protein